MQMMQIRFFPQSGTRGNFIGILWGENPVSLISIIATPIKRRRFKSKWEGEARAGRGRGSLWLSGTGKNESPVVSAPGLPPGLVELPGDPVVNIPVLVEGDVFDEGFPALREDVLQRTFPNWRG